MEILLEEDFKLKIFENANIFHENFDRNSRTKNKIIKIKCWLKTKIILMIEVYYFLFHECLDTFNILLNIQLGQFKNTQFSRKKVKLKKIMENFPKKYFILLSGSRCWVNKNGSH